MHSVMQRLHIHCVDVLLVALHTGAETVRHADLMPSTLLNFRWSEEHRQAMARQPTLKEGLMETAVPATDAL